MKQKPKTKQKFFPNEVTVYVCDYEKGKPVLAVAESFDEITEPGTPVSTYALKSHGKLLITKKVS